MSRFSTLLVALSLGVFWMADCASTRHALVVADFSFAQTVFAVSNAQFDACKVHTPPFTVEVCTETEPIIKKALVDVDGLTAAIQAMPRDGKVPRNLPDLLKNLSELQMLTSAMNNGPLKMDFTLKVQHALDTVIMLLNQFVGVL